MADMVTGDMADFGIFPTAFARRRARRAPSGPGRCPKCGADTVARHGSSGLFYGCPRFPICKGSRSGPKITLPSD